MKPAQPLGTDRESIPADVLIDIAHVGKIFNAGGAFVALENINLQIQSGEFVSIVGKSGSGKSTLANMITGIDHPSSGSVTIAGTQIHTLGESAMSIWRGVHLGIVFQFFQLLPTLSLLENVMLPMDFCETYPLAEREPRARMLLDQVGLRDFAGKLPDQVSGGQQQAAAVARALANDPPILIADEPTGNLDSRTAEIIFDLFLRLAAQGKTVIMVTHDPGLAARTSRIIHIHDGRLLQAQPEEAGKEEGLQ